MSECRKARTSESAGEGVAVVGVLGCADPDNRQGCADPTSRQGCADPDNCKGCADPDSRQGCAGSINRQETLTRTASRDALARPADRVGMKGAGSLDPAPTKQAPQERAKRVTRSAARRGRSSDPGAFKRYSRWRVCRASDPGAFKRYSRWLLCLANDPGTFERCCCRGLCRLASDPGTFEVFLSSEAYPNNPPRRPHT